MLTRRLMMFHLRGCLVLFVAFVGCVFSGCASPSFTTARGLKIFDATQRTTQVQVEAVTDAVVASLGQGQNLTGVKVHLVDKMIDIPQPDGGTTQADGYTNSFDGTIAASVFCACLFVSGLPHELAHMIHDRDQVPDWDHDDVDFWSRVEQLEADLRSRCSAEDLEADAKARQMAAVPPAKVQ